MRRLLSPIALCAVLGACATPGTPGTTPTAFDGTYLGSMAQTHSGTQGAIQTYGCSTPGVKDASLMVQNGKVIWSNGGTSFYVPVAADGSFAAQNGGTYFSGKITNRAMVARGNISGCHTVYDLVKGA